MTELTNVLLVQTGDRFGTAERVLWELATGLPSARYSITAWLSTAGPLDELAESLERRGVAIERRGGPRSRWDARGHLEAWNALRRVAPALIHVQTDGAALPLHLAEVAHWAGAAHLVVSIAGAVEEPAPDRVAQLKAADAVTVAWAACRDALVSGGVPRDRVRVVPPGVELPDREADRPAARRLRAELGAGSFRPVWVCATRLEEGKGHDVLLDALADLKARGATFVVAVAGEGARRAALEHRAAELGLEGSVRFLGEVESLGGLIEAADALLLPALQPSLPLVLLEAMARGCPVVASAVDGVSDVVEDREHGLLTPPGDSAALAEALAYLHRQPEVARRMGDAAADHARSSLTWRHVVGHYEAVYDDLLGLAGFAPTSGGPQPGALGPR